MAPPRMFRISEDLPALPVLPSFVEPTERPRICVIGVGGAGGNALEHMIGNGVTGVEFIAVSSDAQALATSRAGTCIQLSRPFAQAEGGKARSVVPSGEIRAAIEGAQLCFIAAGMGGTTGTDAAAAIAAIARDLGILTVGIVTRPFQFEGRRRSKLAEAGLEALRLVADTLIVIPNEKLFGVAAPDASFKASFEFADGVVEQGVRSIADLLLTPGLVNLDFSDVRAVMKGMGKVVLGTGEASGENRSIDAARAAISNPLVDSAIDGAQHIIISIVGGDDMRLTEINAAASYITGLVHRDAEIIWGSALDSRLDGRMRVSVIATGIGAEIVPAVIASPAHICRLHMHEAQPSTIFNQGFYFSTCRHCGHDMIRSGADWRPVPRGFRVVWDRASRPACGSGLAATALPAQRPRRLDTVSRIRWRLWTKPRRQGAGMAASEPNIAKTSSVETCCP